MGRPSTSTVCVSTAAFTFCGQPPPSHRSTASVMVFSKDTSSLVSVYSNVFRSLTYTSTLSGALSSDVSPEAPALLYGTGLGQRRSAGYAQGLAVDIARLLGS